MQLNHISLDKNCAPKPKRKDTVLSPACCTNTRDTLIDNEKQHRLLTVQINQSTEHAYVQSAIPPFTDTNRQF